VTPGEGRLAFCMRAHEDQLGRTCQSTIRRVALNVRRTLNQITGEPRRIRECESFGLRLSG
jgi:hypothetical protein